jgi:putative ABC transport system permease protein
MKQLRRIFLKLSRLFTNSRQEAELAREIAAHLALLEDDYLRQGMAPEEARQAARRAYGGVEQAKQMHRNERSYQGLAQTLQDTRYTIRQLRKSPGFTITAILMLALGIGATTAIFSIVAGVLLRSLPFPSPDHLVILGDTLEGSDCDMCAQPRVSAADIRNYMRDTHSFTHLGGYRLTHYDLATTGVPEGVNAVRMSGDVFPALRVEPLLGRTFTQDEDEHQQPVVVLSYSLWQSRYQGSANILGTTILLDRKPYVITGVMPRDFEFPLLPGHVDHTQLWVPLRLQPEEFLAGEAASWSFRMVGRLKPGITPAQAQSDAERVAQATVRDYPAYMRSLRIHAAVRPLHEDTVEEARPLVRTLFLAVVVILLIACANLAGLLLVRSIRRRREIAVRLALGARAATLLRQAIVESMVLSLGGGLVGLALAAAALRLGITLLPETLPRIHEIRLNWPVMIFALGLALLTGLVCGLAPAFAAIHTSVNGTLKESGRTGTTGSGHARLRSVLVAAEIAIALVLLAVSGLLLRSFEKMRAVDIGFRPGHTLTARYILPGYQYPTQASVDAFDERVLRELRQLSGVEAVGITTTLPSTGDWAGPAITIEGYIPPKGAGLNLAMVSLLRGDPIQALGIRLLRGRTFTEADNAGSQLVALVNRQLAERYWPGQDPIGKRFRRGMQETRTPWMTVVGEVDSVKMGSPDERTADQFYQPVDQTAISEGDFASAGEVNADYGNILLRTRMEPEQMENALRAAVHQIDPQLPLYHVQTMEHAIDSSEAPRRFNTVLISCFALVAVLLSVLGIYSIIAFTVALREQEMALRMALGCQRSGVLALILTSGVKLAAVGCIFGLLGAAAASRLLRTFLFAVSPFDPVVLTLAAVAMLLLALAASALPARRASRADPMLALRGE